MADFLEMPDQMDPGMDPGMGAPQGPAEGPPKGMPMMDTGGNPSDPFSMVAPGAIDPDEDVPDDVAQAYHEDLVGRVMMAISDNRVTEGRDSSPADAVLQRINVRGTAAPEAIGGTAAELILGITQNAKRQGVEYPGTALLGAGIETVELLMDVAREAGVFPDMPTEEDGETYDEMALLSTLEAAKYYGERMMATGQVDPAEYHKMLTDMMEDEAIEGELDDWNPMDMMNAENFESLLSRGMGQQGTTEEPTNES